MTTMQLKGQRLLTLNAEQQSAIEPILESIENEKHDVFLLHGVTGSGKTEVYFKRYRGD